MPFDPEILIPIVLFLFIFLLSSRVIKNRHERRKWEAMKHQGEGDQSLTTSELQGMIQAAVMDATSEMEERLDRLERPLLETPDRDVPVSKTLGRERGAG